MRSLLYAAALLLLLALPVLAQESGDEAAAPATDDDDSASAGEVEAAPPPPAEPLDPATPVSEIRWRLGEPKPAHWVEPDEDRIRQGREFVLQGWTTDDNGKRSKRASPGYLCTDCHQVEREEPDLRFADPETRLDYAIEQDMTFLPGTTMWGVVNRRSWFNEDYVKKYGTLVEPAHAALRLSVLLCAAECSQGRVLDEWEIDALVAYFWSLRMGLGDLALSQEDLDFLARAVTDEALYAEGVQRLTAGWLAYSPAHARDAPADRSVGYGNPGDPDRGAEVWRRSCLSCHSRDSGPVRGTVAFKDSKGVIKDLWSSRTRVGKGSFYQTISYGTRPYGVPMAYMPFFTHERLSDQQIDDLLSYFEQVIGVEEEK